MAQQQQKDLLDESANLADLVGRIEGPDRDLYSAYRALSIQAAFDDRIFIVYQPQGLNSDGTHRDPNILTTLRCLDFKSYSQGGSSIRVLNDDTDEVHLVTYTPSRPFGLELFMSIPPDLRIKWDGRPRSGGVIRNMSYAMLIKTRSRSDWYSAGVTLCETPKNFKILYPGVTL